MKQVRANTVTSTNPPGEEKKSFKDQGRTSCVKRCQWVKQNGDLEVAIGFSHMEVASDPDKVLAEQKQASVLLP